MAKPLARIVALITPKRRWAQFRLRSLFYLTAFVGIICLWPVMANRAERQRNAIAAVKTAATSVIYDQVGPVTRLLRKWMPTDGGDTAEFVTFLGCDDRDLIQIQPHLQQLPRLRTIRIIGFRVTDTGVAELQSLYGLRVIMLQDCFRVTDEAVAELQKALPNCRISR